MAHQEKSIEELNRAPRIDAERKRCEKVDWDAVREHWLVINLDPTRSPSDEYTLREVAKVFGVSHGWTRTKAAEGEWRQELAMRRRAVRMTLDFRGGCSGVSQWRDRRSRFA